MNTCYSSCPASYYNNNNGGSGPNVCTSCTTACTLCLDGTATNCQACSTNYTLSGTTCSTSCLSGYGPSPTLGLCLLCTYPCLTCNLIASNCTTCDNSLGTLYLYYSGSSLYTCVSTCPNPTFLDLSTSPLSCSLCNTACNSCNNNANNCTACITGYALLNNTCYNPCPNGYYTNGLICSKCDISCTLCSTSPTNCQACAISGPSKSYLLGSTCLASCPNPYFQSDNSGVGPTLCL